MNTFDIASKVSLSGEYILGAEQTGSHACYLIYGVLKAGEQGREIKPGTGHEEILLLVPGRSYPARTRYWRSQTGPGAPSP